MCLIVSLSQDPQRIRSLFGKFRDQIILCLAGAVAENLMNAPPRDMYNALDQQEARLRAELVTYSGRGARTFLDYCEQECRAILGQHWAGVEAIAAALLDRGSLDGDQLRAVWLPSNPARLPGDPYQTGRMA
jgi:hypothetical protein